MESYLVFQVSTSSLLKWKLLEYLWKFYLGIWVSSPHHVFFLYLFPGQKNNEFPSSESSNHHWWSQDSRIGAHRWTRVSQKRCHKSCESWISIKKWGRFSDGFSAGLRCVAWESDGKLGPLGHFDLEKKGKIAIKKGVLETLLPAIGSNMIHLQYFIRLL